METSDHPAYSPPDIHSSNLPHELCFDLWLRIIERLNEGHTLVTDASFRNALEEEYQHLTGELPAADVRGCIRRMVENVNRRYPEMYRAQGVRNEVARVFTEGVRRLGWSAAMVQEHGVRSLLLFSRQDSVRDLLEEIDLRLEPQDFIDCVRHSVEAVKRQPLPLSSHPPPSPALDPASRPPAGPVPRPASPSDNRTAEKLRGDPQVQAAIDWGELDPREFDERVGQETRRSAELEEQELAKLPQRLDAYVARKELTEGEAIKLRGLHRIDQQAARGEIDEQEAEIQRNRVIKRVLRSQLKQKVKDLTAKSARYLQVFEAMKRIDPACDPGLELLIENKDLATARDGPTDELRDFCEALREDEDLLRNILDIMDRRDHELRLLTIRLPPYNAIMKTGLEKIGNLIVEKDFLEDLRNLSLDDMSERLNDPEQAVRVRPAAEMRCFINLVDHVVKPTRLRKELRVLKIGLTIEGFYRSSKNPEQARKQVDRFLQTRLRRLFPDSSGEERRELQERSRDLVNEVEVKLLDRRARGRKKLDSTGKQVFRAESTELSPEEVEKGVQIGRVKMRVGAGGSKLVPFKIMPDPDDPQKFVIAQHDWEKDEVVPQMRRGLKRYVERDREGVWNLVKS